MAAAGDRGWTAMPARAMELRLAPTLLSGMSFRWRHRADPAADAEPAVAMKKAAAYAPYAGGTYVGVLGSTIYEVRENAGGCALRVHAADGRVRAPTAAETSVLARHVRLGEGALSNVWVGAAGIPVRFGRVAAALPGVRVLRISELEALVTFVGSANNNIKRCMQMVSALCAEAGDPIGTDAYGEAHHAFPTAAQLLTLSEARIWSLGWGYRAPRLRTLAQQLEERGGEAYLAGLRDLNDEEARESLCELCGVGRKVADCVLLFGYARDAVVPVDTHCFQLAARLLLPSIRGKPLTAATYQLIVDRFHEVFGAELAGWAFMTLFVGELSDFRRLVDDAPVDESSAVGSSKDGDTVGKASAPEDAKVGEADHEGAPSDECFTRSRRRTRARLTHAARPPAQLSRRCSRRSVRAARSAAKSPYFAD